MISGFSGGPTSCLYLCSNMLTDLTGNLKPQELVTEMYMLSMGWCLIKNSPHDFSFQKQHYYLQFQQSWGYTLEPGDDAFQDN